MRGIHVAQTAVTLATTLGWERLSIGLAAIVGITFLASTGKVGSDAAVGVYTAILGYVLGRSAGEAEASK